MAKEPSKPKKSKHLAEEPEKIALIAFHLTLGTPWQILEEFYGASPHYKSFYEISVISDPVARNYYLKLKADHANQWVTYASETIKSALHRANELMPHLEAGELCAMIQTLSNLVNDRDLSRSHSVALLRESYGSLNRDDVLEADVAEVIEKMIAPAAHVEITEEDRAKYPHLPPLPEGTNGQTP